MTFPGDTSNDIGNDNSERLRVIFNLATGPDDISSEVSTWTSSNIYRAVTGQDNFMDNTSNEFYLTGVQLEVGDVATDFEHRSYGDELARCQRYYFEIQGSDGTNLDYLYPMVYSNNTIEIIPTFPVPLRGSPTVTFSGTVKCRCCATSIVDTALTLGGSAWEAVSNNVTTGHMWATASSGTPFSIGHIGRILSGASPSSVNFDAEI